MPKSAGERLRFTFLRLQNWRKFTQVECPLAGRAFLVGPNASGKSNLLDVFRFLRDLVSVGGGLQSAVARRGGISRLRCLAARRAPEIHIYVRVGSEENPNQWEYELWFDQRDRKDSRPYILKERVVFEAQELLARPNPEDNADPERLTQTHLEQVYVNQPFRPLTEFFSTVQYLHLVPQIIREPDRAVGKVQDPFGGDFLERIAATGEKLRRSRLRSFRKILQIAVPQ
ncbi:MAG: AAA family ATPase, partial [Thermoguttaceae bacterium]|nr:AAA family ATPase [Thermoguttaceae bacterium]